VSTIYDALTAFFDEDDWRYEVMPDRNCLRLGFAGKNANFMCYAQAHESIETLVFYSVYPLRVPENKRLAAAEYLTRANYGLFVGNFELDFRDGEVRFKTSIDAEDADVAPLIKQIVYTNVVMADKYFHGLMQVIYSDVEPKLAVEQAETRTGVEN
jgi:hypothetical protein